MKKLWRILTILLVLIAGMLLGAIITMFQQKKIISHFRTQNQSKFAKFDIVDQLLNQEYIAPDQLKENQDQMLENALRAYVEGINDRYTNYLSKEENDKLNQMLHEDSGIQWIGAVIQKRENYIQIEEIIKNGPAYKAGLLPLDKIFFIDTGSTQDLTTNQAVQLIRGEIGTEVQLFIQRETKDGEITELQLTITREKIEIPSVLATLIEQDGKKIWLFEISSISDHTTKLFLNELVAFMREGMQGIILDLRGNSGGYLEEASKFLGHFIPKGEITVRSEYQAYESVEFVSKGNGELTNIPTVIIIDQLTASAGEIIALTLQEKGIPIIGMQSLGKGTIQTVTELNDGSSLKYTIGNRLSPNHASINLTGIIPDIEVERNYESYIASGFDNQLETAKQTLLPLIKTTI